MLGRAVQVRGGVVKVTEVPPSKLPAHVSARLPMPTASTLVVTSAARLASREADPTIGGHMACARHLPKPVVKDSQAPLLTVPAAMASGVVDLV